MSKQTSALAVNQLRKEFPSGKGKTFVAVDGISFSVGRSEIVGLLGPNGAGKTTTMQMLLGLMSPTAGSIKYFDMSLEEHRAEIMPRINFTSGYARFPWRMTVWENLDVMGHLYEVPNHRQKIKEIAAAFDGTHLLNQKFQDLSAGQMTRSLLMKAFINDPELVLLDEPTASLDPDIAESIREYILKQRRDRGMSILITSHNMQEVEELCDRVVFLHHGKVLATDTPDNLARRNTKCQVQLMVKDGLKRLIELVQKRGFSYTESKRFIIIQMPEDELASFLSTMGNRGLQYSEIEIHKPSLEDFFVSISKGTS